MTYLEYDIKNLKNKISDINTILKTLEDMPEDATVEVDKTFMAWLKEVLEELLSYKQAAFTENKKRNYSI